MKRNYKINDKYECRVPFFFSDDGSIYGDGRYTFAKRLKSHPETYSANSADTPDKPFFYSDDEIDAWGEASWIILDIFTGTHLKHKYLYLENIVTVDGEQLFCKKKLLSQGYFSRLINRFEMVKA